MTHPGADGPTGPPGWPHCGRASTTDDPVGCRGFRVTSYTACLAHLADDERATYLAGLTPGADINHPGTTFTEPLLRALLNALRDPDTGSPHLGKVWFSSATFQDTARFNSATFESEARFISATFQGDARFEGATFRREAHFESATFQHMAGFMDATFERTARFEEATFQSLAYFQGASFESIAGFNRSTFQRRVSFEASTIRDAWFDSACFPYGVTFKLATFLNMTSFASTVFGNLAGFESAEFQNGAWFDSASFQEAWFGSATFQGIATFRSATFLGGVRFEAVTFQGDVWLEQAVFERTVTFGPLVCAGRMKLSGALFSGPATLLLAARSLECRRTRWSSTAELRLRYTNVDFSHAVFEYPLTIAAEADPFVLASGQSMAEQTLADAPDPSVRVASLRGVDAAHLVLADVDISRTLFTGTVHLDQLRLEGDCAFDKAPAHTHWRRWPPTRFTPRRVLAEEHHWRAKQPSAVRGWNPAVFGGGNVGPLQLAPVYRALRKAFEDGKHEPGAADFYYGEMEMRRHADDIPPSERFLLTLYWALSGYGLRASRALGWLVAAMLITILLMMGFGLPAGDPKQEATGTVPTGGGKVTFEIDKADPQNPTGDRFTGERFEKALNVTLNSVVFRSSGQDLTTAGAYIEMTSRLVEPILLGLAAVAVRNRVRR